MIMTARKSMWVLFGILAISAWVLGSAVQAEAETMKCKTSAYAVKREVFPIPDFEGHSINMLMRDGLAFFEDGEVATFKNFTMSDVAAGKVVLTTGYQLFTFVDGSTIITSIRNEQQPDPEGKFSWFVKGTGEIRKGTGRFEGIKGSVSITGKQFKAEKGDLTGKSTTDCIFTYTLPSK
jgi:hypothetical protein